MVLRPQAMPVPPLRGGGLWWVFPGPAGEGDTSTPRPPSPAGEGGDCKEEGSSGDTPETPAGDCPCTPGALLPCLVTSDPRPLTPDRTPKRTRASSTQRSSTGRALTPGGKG